MENEQFWEQRQVTYLNSPLVITAGEEESKPQEGGGENGGNTTEIIPMHFTEINPEFNHTNRSVHIDAFNSQT